MALLYTGLYLVEVKLLTIRKMNLTALNNITPYTVNNSLVNQTEDIGVNLISNANELTNGYFGLGIMMIIFIMLV